MRSVTSFAVEDVRADTRIAHILICHSDRSKAKWRNPPGAGAPHLAFEMWVLDDANNRGDL